MSYIYYQNKELYYTEMGQGPVVLLLHGNTASSNMFLDVVKLYAQSFRVILIDFLGHGKSSRLAQFPVDLWYEEALQVVAVLDALGYNQVNIIGTSGGAQVAIHVALLAGDRIHKVIADSFEGEYPIASFVSGIIEERKKSKKDSQTVAFYEAMHGSDWEQIIDQDTMAIEAHAKQIGRFFQQPLDTLRPDILFTGSKQDEFIQMISPHYFEEAYEAMLQKIGHGSYHLFETGGHPAMLSNPLEFYLLSKQFFMEDA